MARHLLDRYSALLPGERVEIKPRPLRHEARAFAAKTEERDHDICRLTGHDPDRRSDARCANRESHHVAVAGLELLCAFRRDQKRIGPCELREGARQLLEPGIVRITPVP